MWKRLAWVSVSLLAIAACKGKDEAPAPAPADSAAAQAAASFAEAAAALAKAQAAASAGAVTDTATGALASATPTASAAPSASASASAEPGFTAALTNELGRLGFSTTAAALTALGKDRGVLLSGLGRLTGHPAALSAIFNNDKVVSAFTKRPDMQEACRDSKKMENLLLYVLSSPAARNWVSDPESIKAFTGSKLGLQLQACPGFKAIEQQPRALSTLTKDNAAATTVISNPNFRAELDRLKIRQDPPGKIFTKRLR